VKIMDEVIQTENLTVRYGLREALTSLTVRITKGAVGLLGPNGAGKSTLIKTLLGLLPPAAGTAEILGKQVVGQSVEIRQQVGYMPERNGFVPGLSAVEAVALAGELGGLPRPVALERAHEVLRFAGLGEARYRQVESYSTGMLQRTKLATALVHDPELVLLDEPTNGLDPVGRRQMLDLIRDINHRHGISVLLSTHLLHDVEAVCDSVALLKAGKLILSGNLETLKRKPGGMYELRAKESTPGRFASALSARGAVVSESQDGLLRVTLEDPDTRLLFETAKKIGAELRYLRRFEPSLEEVFLNAVGVEES
jgi:ABC-2 type transport system ATP-binding protein